MSPEAHSRKNCKPRFPTNKAAVLLISMILLIGIAVGTTIAFLVARAELQSTFEYAKVSCEVTGARDNVQVKNTGDTPAFIRAAYVVTWRDGNGNVVVSIPSGYSYTLTENLGNYWSKGTDGYFYYSLPVSPQSSTEESPLNCTVTYPENSEYTLSVEVLAEAIQSEPAEAVQQAWGATIVDGKLTPAHGN